MHQLGGALPAAHQRLRARRGHRVGDDVTLPLPLPLRLPLTLPPSLSLAYPLINKALLLRGCAAADLRSLGHQGQRQGLQGGARRQGDALPPRHVSPL